MSEILDLLLEIGIVGTEVSQGQQIRADCPFHDDRHPSFYVSSGTGAWYCHAGCGGGSIVELIQRLKSEKRLPQQRQVRTVPGREIARTAMSALQEWQQRGIDREMLSRWGMRWDSVVGATRIPFLGVGGESVSEAWRLPAGRVPKYLYPKGFRKSDYLYPWDRLVSASDSIVLVEGPTDAVWLWEAGLPAAAVLGAFVSSTQISLLRSLGQRILTLCFDNDLAGRVATWESTRRLREEGFILFRVRLPKNYKDIQQVPLAQVGDVMSRRELAVQRGFVHPQHRRWLLEDLRGEKGKIWRYDDAGQGRHRASGRNGEGA